MESFPFLLLLVAGADTNKKKRTKVETSRSVQSKENFPFGFLLIELLDVPWTDVNLGLAAE